MFLIFLVRYYDIGYLYARKKFGWDAPDWAMYSTVVSSVFSLGCSKVNYLPFLTRPDFKKGIFLF